MNTIRKRLSGVKGGRFAQAVRPAAGVQHRAQRHSGRPAGYDRQRPGGARTPLPARRLLAIAEKYRLALSALLLQALLRQETPKTLPNVTTQNHRQRAGAVHAPLRTPAAR